MPFLRAVGSTASPQPSVEIKSAKTLVGSGHAKCDVVLPRDRGVLDLHALLNLSDNDRATATLVPFSATSDGACFLNGRLVPPEGAAVVHGDRLAFGNADNAFVFSLTEPKQQPVETHTTSLSNARSFRRTVDALRGDRTLTASHPATRKPDQINKALSTSASRDSRLERFLADASTDSLLGDFVERKLQSSSSASASKRLRQNEGRPTAMEPPPSLSASSVSSLRSSLNDSILDRTAHQREGVSVSDTKPLFSKSQSLLSTAERNYAEIEKLRLSHRMREVNNVLNGHLHFGSSYLTTERRSSSAASVRFSSPVKQAKRSIASDHAEDQEDEEEESAEELPTLVEKPPRKLAIETASTAPPLNPPRPAPSLQSSIASLLGKRLQNHPTAAHEDLLGNDEDVEVPVDESLPSFSEAILKRRTDTTERVAISAPPDAIRQPVAKTDMSELNPDVRKTRPQLHQQLIDRTLRRKRHECLTDAFLLWRRGLRVQQQRRRDKAKQLQLVDRNLQLLRRNHSFSRWKRMTEHKHQVLECREEAFTQRQHTGVLRRLWTQWAMATLRAKHTRRLLRRCVVSLGTYRLRSGFQRWRVHIERLRSTSREQSLAKKNESSFERRMEAIARTHHQVRVRNPHLQRVVQGWHRLAAQKIQRKRVLRRILQSGFRRHQLRALITWKQITVVFRQTEQMDQQRQTEVAKTTETAAQQLHAREQELQDHHEKQLSELRAKLEEQQQQIRAFETDKQDAKKRLVDAKATAKIRWSSASEELLKKAIADADTQITHVSARLEMFLQQMDTEPDAARFHAASFLVESMLEQKMRHVNARVEAQEDMLKAMRSSGFDEDETSADNKLQWKSTLTHNGRFLLEMVQQRHARLHQLHQAIAKLAATIVDRNTGTRSQRPHSLRVDAAKFKHAAFLTDTMRDRTQQQLDALLPIHHRHAMFTDPSSSMTRSTRPARKY